MANYKPLIEQQKAEITDYANEIWYCCQLMVPILRSLLRMDDPLVIYLFNKKYFTYGKNRQNSGTKEQVYITQSLTKLVECKQL